MLNSNPGTFLASQAFEKKMVKFFGNNTMTSWHIIAYMVNSIVSHYIWQLQQIADESSAQENAKSNINCIVISISMIYINFHMALFKVRDH